MEQDEDRIQLQPGQEFPLEEGDPFLTKMREMNLFQKYPVVSRLAYTVYLDLKVVKKWNCITIQEDESLHLCYLLAKYSETKISLTTRLHNMVMKLCKDYVSSAPIPNAEEIPLDLEIHQEQPIDVDFEIPVKSKKRQIAPEEISKRAEISNMINKLSSGLPQVNTLTSTHRVLNIAFIAPDSTITYYRMFSYLVPPKE